MLVVVATLNVEVPDPPRDDGLRVQVAVAGQPPTESATVSLKPFSAVTATVDVPVSPGLTVSDVGLADMAKSAVAGAPQPLNLKDPMRVYQP